MKDFSWTEFSNKIAVKSDLASIYKAWTTSSEVEKWFLSKCQFFDEKGEKLSGETLISEGCSYQWSWYLYDIVESGNIIITNSKDHLQFTFAGNCIVDVKLTQEGEYVIVELTQSNIPTDDESKRGIRLGCFNGWSFYLLNLKSIYEGGIDLRNKEGKFKGMVNN